MQLTSKLSRVTILGALLLLFTYCHTNRATEGAVIGGTAGGVAGGVIGEKAGNTVIGVLIGAAVGGTAGALIGRYMDKQAEALEEELEDAEVTRVGEGILLTFDSGLLFDYDSYQLREATRENLQEMAGVLQDYEDTEILIEGHTDATGPEEYNQRLSQQRANSVADYLRTLGVEDDRLTTVGYGEQQPVKTNETAAGRQENRRVEVAIYANEQLIEKAQEMEAGERLEEAGTGQRR